jgi:hypothetical protein
MDTFFLPQKRRRTEYQWVVALGSGPLRETTLISGARCRFSLNCVTQLIHHRGGWFFLQSASL